MISQELRDQTMKQAQGAVALQIAFIGIANSLFSNLATLGKATPEELASQAGMDPEYVNRWCDAAYAFGYLDEKEGKLILTNLGLAFQPDMPGTLMPFAVQSALSAHMAERAIGLMQTGERPGGKVLAERESILSWFGPMLEATFGQVFKEQILPFIPVYREADLKGGLVVDLGCGNGWYLRYLAKEFPHLQGIGLDGFEENIRQAELLSRQELLNDRLKFYPGDLHHFSVDEPVDLIVMNRALHHVWNEKENVFRIIKEHLKKGGSAVIWEPNWPNLRADLRDPSRRGMAFQNLSEHIQGNHFLQVEEIEAEFQNIGMKTSVYLFANGNEAVVVGKKD